MMMAETSKARVWPGVGAGGMGAGGAWWAVVVAAGLARMARPIAPPIWIAVSDTPETRPECSSLTPETADRVAGTNVIPSPIPTTISGSMAPLMYELWGVRLLSHSSPIAAMAVPVAISGRMPVWTTSLETNPALAIMTTVKGMKAAPALSGE